MALNNISDSIFNGINLPDSVTRIIKMSLEDGVLTDREKELIKRKALAEGIDEIEFDFYFEKIEERFNSLQKAITSSPAKTLKAAFDSLKSIAEGGKGVIPTEQITDQLSLIPGISTGAAITGAVASVLNIFIKEPSNLNSLKAEVIKHVQIPKDIDLIVEFLDYAQASIVEEKQRIKAKSGLSGISNFVAGGELDIIPVWQLKIKQVITASQEDLKDNPEALKRLKKYQTSPTDKLKKLIATTAGLPVKLSSLFAKVGVPDVPDDLMELMSFVRQMAQSSDPRAAEFREHLFFLQAEGQRKFPEKAIEIETHSIRVSPLQKLKESLKGGNARLVLAETKIPGDEDEFFDMIRFVESQARSNSSMAIEFKNFLGRMYNYGLARFPENRMELSTYRPHSLDILKHQLSSITSNSDSDGVAGFLKEITGEAAKQYENELEEVLRNFPTPTDFDDLIEVLAFVKDLAGKGGKANIPFMEFQNRLYSDAKRVFPDMEEQIYPFRITANEKFKLYADTHSLNDAIASFKTPMIEEDFFDLIMYAQQKAKTDSSHKDEYEQLQKRLYLDGKAMGFDSDRLKRYKVKKFGFI